MQSNVLLQLPRTGYNGWVGRWWQRKLLDHGNSPGIRSTRVNAVRYLWSSLFT